MMPKDPVMLLSYINTQLRDHYPSLEELCSSLAVEEAWLRGRLEEIDYRYDEEQNQFI